MFTITPEDSAGTSRRRFLQTTGLAAGLCVAGAVPGPARAASGRRAGVPVLNLQSDSCAPPTKRMLAAMAGGTTLWLDDVARTGGTSLDPTVAQLEREVAKLLGTEDALFLPSGVIGNQIALRILVDEQGTGIAGDSAHVAVIEHGFSIRRLVTVPDPSGLPDEAAVRAMLAANAQGRSAILAENPLMLAGAILSGPDALARLAKLGPVHLDGARLFSAALALKTSVKELAAPATTVMLTLSKVLAAPVGSLLAGPRELVAAASDERLKLGGLWAKPGPIAAAALVALHDRDSIARDHRLARRAAVALARALPDGSVEPSEVRTNLVYVKVPSFGPVITALAKQGIHAIPVAPDVIRLAFHRGIPDSSVEYLATSFARALKA